MNKSFTVDFIEQKKELLFLAGTATSPLALGDTFALVLQSGKSASSKQSKGAVTLKIESIFINGEPLDSAEANQGLLLAVSGDGQALLDAAEALKWQKKGGRILRDSEAVLSLESSET